MKEFQTSGVIIGSHFSPSQKISFSPDVSCSINADFEAKKGGEVASRGLWMDIYRALLTPFSIKCKSPLPSGSFPVFNIFSVQMNR